MWPRPTRNTYFPGSRAPVRQVTPATLLYRCTSCDMALQQSQHPAFRAIVQSSRTMSRPARSRSAARINVASGVRRARRPPRRLPETGLHPARPALKPGFTPLERALDPGFHGARTHWIRGFMAFRLARHTRPMVLAVPVCPESGFRKRAARPRASRPPLDTPCRICRFLQTAYCRGLRYDGMWTVY
jgi:hypothetical protein